MQPAAFLCDLCVICVICERITRKSTQSIYTKKPQCIPQISLSYADKTQNHINRTNCLSLRNNAALLHSSAGSALSAGEYSHKSTQAIYTNETQCLSLIPLIYADKPQNHINRTNCLSLRNNAALLHSSAPSAPSAREYTQEYSSYRQRRNLNVSR